MSDRKGLISASGTSFEIIKTLANGVKEIGGEEYDIRRILSDRYVREKIIQILCSKTETLWTGSVIIDHSKTLRERLENYSMVISNLLKEYTIQTKDRKTKVELVLLRFNKKILIDQAIEEVFKEKNLEMAGLEELIALGLQHSHVVFKFATHPEGLILATASSRVSDKRSYLEVPSLFWSNNISLSTHQFVLETSYYTPFLFVKKVEPFLN